MKFPAAALYNQSHIIAEDADNLRALSQAVNWPGDLSLSQWCHWYAVALEYKPDLIIELGRKDGNSTAVFTQAAHRLHATQIKSFCDSPNWDARTFHQILQLKGKDWFKPLQIFNGDFTTVNFEELIKKHNKILLLWDAHGFDVADHILSHIMPLLSEREHVVICHDVSDSRLFEVKDYEGKAFWRNMDSCNNSKGKMARLKIFWLDTIVDQFIPILDFCNRNHIELHSADWEVKTDLLENNEAYEEFVEVIPADCFQTMNHWAYFSLNEYSGTYTFPAKLEDVTGK